MEAHDDLLLDDEREGAGDVNLRGVYGPHTAWAGYYEQPGEFRQARVGYEYTVRLPAVQVVIGAQYASQGFFGGGVAAAIGGDVYGLIGVSRTNEKPYFNLNFDPNDAWIFGSAPAAARHEPSRLPGPRRVGGRRAAGDARGVSDEADAGDATRLDLFYKSGPLDGEDGGTVRTAGASVSARLPVVVRAAHLGPEGELHAERHGADGGRTALLTATPGSRR